MFKYFFHSLIMIFINSLIWAQETEVNYTQKIRILYDQHKYSQIYQVLLPLLKTDQNIAESDSNWFFYTMLAESAYKIHKINNLKTLYSKNRSLYLLYKGMRFASLGAIIDGALTLNLIEDRSPEVNYLIGKLYYLHGDVYPGTAYFRLASDMKSAPYGLYYDGLAQESAGHFSRAVSLLEKAQSLVLPDEKNLLFHIQVHLASAYFSNEEYQKAYELAIKSYPQHNAYVIKNIDPGLILVSMGEYKKARNFWLDALKDPLPLRVKKMLQERLSYNKFLLDPNYPPAWMRK